MRRDSWVAAVAAVAAAAAMCPLEVQPPATRLWAHIQLHSWRVVRERLGVHTGKQQGREDGHGR